MELDAPMSRASEPTASHGSLPTKSLPLVRCVVHLFHALLALPTATLGQSRRARLTPVGLRTL